MAETREIQGVWAVMVLVMFLLGGAIGYIVRDVRADEQVKAAAVEARQELARTANAALTRVQQVGHAVTEGVRATAESTTRAIAKPAPDPAPASDDKGKEKARP